MHDVGKAPGSASVGLASSGAEWVLHTLKCVCERLYLSLPSIHPLGQRSCQQEPLRGL